MFVSRFMPCDGCGESLDMTDPVPHECAPERRAEFQMFALRDEVADFPARFDGYLQTPYGQFEVWLAARQVRRAG